MGTLIAIVAAIATIFVVVLIHELGHYWVARAVGIRVLKFSIGFGKVLCSKTTQSGTEFALSAIPLGGFVKMHGDGIERVPEAERAYAYNEKPVWARMAVVAAGPGINFLLAILLFWIVFLGGSTTLKPIVGQIIPASPAAIAGLKQGDQVLSVAGEPIDNWSGFTMKILAHIGQTNIPMTVRDQAGHQETKTLSLAHWTPDPGNPNLTESVGFYQYLPPITPVIAEVQKGSAAAKAGLKPGDKLLKIDGKPYSTWQDMMPVFKQGANKALSLTLLRNGKQQTLPVTLGSHRVGEKTYGFLGVVPVMPKLPDALLQHHNYSVLQALQLGIGKTNELIRLNIVVLGKLFTGQLSVKVLGGPITVFQGAGHASHLGWLTYLSFLAFINVSLGFVNLLPVPGLDGGHLVFLCLEAIKRKPLSEQFQSVGIRLGFTLLIMLMLLATYNDLVRLFFTY